MCQSWVEVQRWVNEPGESGSGPHYMKVELENGFGDEHMCIDEKNSRTQTAQNPILAFKATLTGIIW